MKNTKSKTLILSLVNHNTHEQSADSEIIEHLKTLHFSNDIEFATGTDEGFDLVKTLSGQHNVIIIDTTESDADPGTILRLTPEDFINVAEDLVNLHHIDVRQTLAITYLLGSAPQRVVLFAIVESNSDSAQAVLSTLKKVGNLVSQEIDKL